MSQRNPQSDIVHDDTLIDWLLSLSPAERLAELESRLAFFHAARRDDDTKLIAQKKALGRNKDRAMLRLLEEVLRRRRD